MGTQIFRPQTTPSQDFGGGTKFFAHAELKKNIPSRLHRMRRRNRDWSNERGNSAIDRRLERTHQNESIGSDNFSPFIFLQCNNQE